MQHFIVLFFYSANPSEFHWILQKILGILIIAILVIGVAYFIGLLLLKKISSYFKVETKKVEIVKIGSNGQKTLYGDGRNKQQKTIVVLLLDKKKKRKLYMSGEGIKEGDIGTLIYQGILARKFEREGSVYDEKKNLYYHFGFSNRRKEVHEDKKRIKRKYW